MSASRLLWVVVLGSVLVVASIAFPASALLLERANSTPASHGLSSDPAGSAGTYVVTFTESGLPAGTNWSVKTEGRWAPLAPSGVVAPSVEPLWHHGLTNNSTSTTIGFTLPNGTYGFWVPGVADPTTLFLPSPPHGHLAVNGSAASVDVAFTAVPLYDLTFSETGLPSGTNWTVGLGPVGPWGATPLPTASGSMAGAWGAPVHSSTGTTVTFPVPNGTYFFWIPNVTVSTTVYVPTPFAGNTTVNGASVTVDVAFTAVQFYTLTFAESGLPAGTNWSVAIAGGGEGSWGWGSGPAPAWSGGSTQFNCSSNATINFTVPNGNYSLVIGNATNGSGLYVPSPATGNVTVHGAAVTVAVKFTWLALYNITFAETGLPSGSWWSVGIFNASVGFSWNGSTNSTVNFTVPNGVYNFSVWSGWNGSGAYVPTPAIGTVTVNGANVTVSIKFVQVTFYQVTFVETGLPSGSTWYVATASGTWGWALNESETTSISFQLTNGTYGFSVGPVWTNGAFYLPSPAYGLVTVAGSGVTVDVTFSPLSS